MLKHMTETDEARKAKVQNIIDRGVISGILPNRDEFIRRLVGSKPMRIYIGADPTSTSLHLSHAKNYMLLEEFRKLGHEVIVLFGDFTARIGDPTDRDTARKQLSSEEVKTNVAEWLEQIRPLMDFDAKENPPQVKFNAEWLTKLTMEDVINLTSMVTVQQMLERDMFEKRLKEEKPIHLHEFLYPLMQGYDSVAMDVDVELCGTDQTFNALMGRTLLKQIKGKEKFVVTVNLMENPKTRELMSKSRGTGVFLNTDAVNKFGAIMAQPDEMIELILVNNTRVELDEIEVILKGSPLDAKRRAAYEVTKLFHGEEAAVEAGKQFSAQFSKRSFSELTDVPRVSVETQGSVLLIDILLALGFASSKSEARRLAEGGGVQLVAEGTVADVKKCTVDEVTKETLGQVFESFSAGKPGDANYFLKVGRSVAKLA